MTGAVVFERDSGSIEMQNVVPFEYFGWDCSCRGRRESKLPVFDERAFREVLAGVLVSDDGCPFGVHPFISVSVVEVPIGVNEVFDGVVTDFRECGSDLGTRW